MKNKENQTGTVYKKIMGIKEIVRNSLISVVNLMKTVFCNHHHTKSLLFLPEGNRHLLENGTGKDFYSAPVRICRKSLRSFGRNSVRSVWGG